MIPEKLGYLKYSLDTNVLFRMASYYVATASLLKKLYQGGRIKNDAAATNPTL